MSSFKRTGARGKGVAAKPPVASTPVARDDIRNGRGSDGGADPWFTPGPKRTAALAADGIDEALPPPSDGDRPADWFLPSGRAGLQPDSITDSLADGALTTASPPAQAEAASSPPWAADSASLAVHTPPPWENGPWPGPGETAPARQPASPLSRSAPAELADDSTLAGLLQRRSVRLALAGCAAVVLIVIIVVIVTPSGGGCGTYPAQVRQAYARAMTDLRNHASASVQLAAFQQAASQANASAAAAGQIGVRTALFTMAGDLDQAHADMTAHRALPPALLQHLTADGTALPASC